MQLHEWYKCSTCPEFHPVELDFFLKLWLKATLPSDAQEEMNSETNLSDHNTALYMMLEAKTFHETCLFSQEVERGMAFLKSVKPEHCIDPKIPARFQQDLEIDYHIVKRIKANLRICVSQLKSIFEETAPVLTWRHYAVQLFAADAHEQWTEIKSFQLHIKPVWFVANRVYQLSTKMVAATSDYFSRCSKTRTYKCQIMINGESRTILTFKYQYSTVNLDEDICCTEQLMPIVLATQTDPTYNTSAYTGILQFQAHFCRFIFRAATLLHRSCNRASCLD